MSIMADLVADINDGPLTKKVLALEKLAGDAAQLAAHAGVVAAQLAHSSPMVRQSALDALLRLPPAELTAHADALVATFAPKFPVLPAEMVRHIVFYWAHVGFY